MNTISSTFRARRRRHPRRRPALEVTALEDRNLLSTSTMINTDDSGPGPLRQAVLDEDGAAGSTIDFNIPGPGVHTIRPQSALSALTEPMTIRARIQSMPSLACKPTVK